jgi:hypothetical protein
LGLALLQQVNFAGAKEAQVAQAQPEHRVLLAVSAHLQTSIQGNNPIIEKG